MRFYGESAAGRIKTPGSGALHASTLCKFMVSIFKDRSKLSPRYIPERLPHRKGQIGVLLSLYEHVLEDPENAFLQVTQIVCGVGTGKHAPPYARNTASVLHARHLNSTFH